MSLSMGENHRQTHSTWLLHRNYHILIVFPFIFAGIWSAFEYGIGRRRRNRHNRRNRRRNIRRSVQNHKANDSNAVCSWWWRHFGFAANASQLNQLANSQHYQFKSRNIQINFNRSVYWTPFLFESFSYPHLQLEIMNSPSVLWSDKKPTETELHD